MSATIHLAMMGGLAVAFPVATIGVYQLLSPLLMHRQRRLVLIFLPAVFVSYLGGAAFAYFVMLPVGLKFLLHFGEGVAVPLINITEYMSLVTAMIVWLGVIFDLPLVMFLLTKLRLVRYELFRRMHRYVPAAAFILSALLTPTFDVINQLLVAVPIILLFEVGLFLSWLAKPRDRGHETIAQEATAKAVSIWRRLLAKVASIWRWLWTFFIGPPQP